MVDKIYQPMTKARMPLTARTLRKERRDCGALYRLIRARLGLTQVAMAALMGCSKDALVRREHTKRLYSLVELQILREVSQLPNDEWCALLEEIAK